MTEKLFSIKSEESDNLQIKIETDGTQIGEAGEEADQSNGQEQKHIDKIIRELRELKQRNCSQIKQSIQSDMIQDHVEDYNKRIKEESNNPEQWCESLLYNTEERWKTIPESHIPNIWAFITQDQLNYLKLLLCADFAIYYSQGYWNNLVGTPKKKAQQYNKVGKRMYEIFKIIPPGSQYLIKNISFTSLNKLKDDEFSQVIRHV